MDTDPDSNRSVRQLCVHQGHLRANNASKYAPDDHSVGPEVHLHLRSQPHAESRIEPDALSQVYFGSTH